MYSYLERLNGPQKEAATTIEGPLLVLAGAGTGKTSVITARIAYMIDMGIQPSSILGVTFTNKAAKEMRERLDKLIGEDSAKGVTLGTFHSVCGRILRKYIHFAGHYNSSFGIADDSDQKSIVRQAAASLGLPKDNPTADDILSYISRCKNKMMFPEDALADESAHDPVLARIYEKYQLLLELQNVVDFDDMLLLTLKIFRTVPEALKECQDRWKYLLVDEYQDTNDVQFQLVKMLAGATGNLCVVGDDDQSIYAWRGANLSNILSFPEYFPGTKEIKLEQNYRSTNTILGAANAIISRNSRRYDKKLWSAKGTGEPIKIVRAANGEAEAAFVVNTIRNLAARGEYNLSDFAILFRSNYLSRTFEQEFRKHGIRPRVIGGQEFFQRKEVKDAAAYLKLVVNRRDDQSLLRIIGVPPRGIGEKAVLKLRDMQKGSPAGKLLETMESSEWQSAVTPAARNSAEQFLSVIREASEAFRGQGDLAAKTKEYLDAIGYLNGLQKVYKDLDDSEKRQENVYEFISSIGLFEKSFIDRNGYAPSLGDFLETFSLMDDNDRTEEDADGPVLSTVHASKGLEYPYVFIVGMEHTLFPHERALLENSEDEERRLFYVAVTRARENLIMTYADERFRFNVYEKRRPSEFLKDIPDDLAEKDVPDSFSYEADDTAKRSAFDEILAMLRESGPGGQGGSSDRF